MLPPRAKAQRHKRSAMQATVPPEAASHSGASAAAGIAGSQASSQRGTARSATAGGCMRQPYRIPVNEALPCPVG